MTGKEPLTPARAAELYRAGWSACEIAAAAGRNRTADGVARMIGSQGLGGLIWCRLHSRHEDLQLRHNTL
jgi:hypothetical protein